MSDPKCPICGNPQHSYDCRVAHATSCAEPFPTTPKPLGSRHAHIALMAATICAGYSAGGLTNWEYHDCIVVAREILAEVEAQDGK